MPESSNIGFVEGKKIKGYGVRKKTFEGYRIGPLFADD